MYPNASMQPTLVALRQADDRRRADRFRAVRLARATSEPPERPPPALRRRRRHRLSWL